MNVIWEKKIETSSIAITPRPVWKCKTCEFYSKRPSCPPFVPSWKEAKELLEHYTFALLIKFNVDMSDFENEKREIIKYLLKEEKRYFNTYPFVFSLFPGACNLCEKCQFEKGGKCPYPTKVRPSLDAIGIELSSIVKINYKDSVLYSLILLN